MSVLAKKSYDSLGLPSAIHILRSDIVKHGNSRIYVSLCRQVRVQWYQHQSEPAVEKEILEQ